MALTASAGRPAPSLWRSVCRPELRARNPRCRLRCRRGCAGMPGARLVVHDRIDAWVRDRL